MEPINNSNSQAQPQNPVSVPPQPVVSVPPTPPTPLTPPPAPPTPPAPTFVPPVMTAPPPPAVPMQPFGPAQEPNSWKTFSMILLGMVVLGAAICAFIWYSGRPVVVPETAEILEDGFYRGGDAGDDDDDVMAVVGLVDAYIDGTLYTNEIYDFTMQVPEGWKVDWNHTDRLLSPSSQEMVGNMPGPILDISFYIASGDPGHPPVTQEAHPPYITNVKKKLINGLEFTTYQSSDHYDRDSYGYQVSRNGVIYAFHAFTPENVPVLEKMLSTLKFAS